MESLKTLLKSSVVGFTMLGTIVFSSIAESAVLGPGPLADGAVVQFEGEAGFGSISDSYSFELQETSNVTFTLNEVTSLPVGPFVFPLDFDALMLTLDTSPIESIVLPDNNSIQTGSFTVTLLAGYLYNLSVSGFVPSESFGGKYSGSVEVSAVPLPAAFWLFFTAIFSIVGLAKAKRKVVQLN